MDQRAAKTFDYFEKQAVSGQWAPFLRALGELINQQMSRSDVRAFLRALGKRMADNLPLPPCDTLEELTRCLNIVWRDLGWGWVSVEEQEQWISIEHIAAPIGSAMGDPDMRWTPALLEGIYGEWFRQFGAGEPLILAEVGDPESRAEDPLHALHFRLGHPSVLDA